MSEYLKPMATFIREIGFPVFVALYFLVMLGPKVDALTKAVERLVIVTESKK